MPDTLFSDDDGWFAPQWRTTWIGAGSAVLGLAVALTMYLVGHRIEGLHPLDRILIAVMGAGAVLWGLWQMGRDLLQRGQAQGAARTLHGNGRPKATSSQSFSRSISWMGIGLILLGMEFLVTLRWRHGQGVPMIVILFAAWFSIGLGSWRIALGLWPRFAHSRLKHRVSISRQGYFYLLMMSVFFLGSLLGRSNMLMLVFAFMAGPFILNGWVTFWMLRWVGVSRRIPARAMAGEPFQVQLTLANRRVVLASSLTSVVDAISREDEQIQAGILFARVPPRSERTASYTLRLLNRGRYRLGPVTIATRYPLGMVERSYRCDLPGELLVYPRIGRLTSHWERDLSRDAEQSRLAHASRGLFEDEFHAMREYRVGDNPRAIHWKTSARQNELMVREYHQQRGQDLLVLVDLWQPPSPADDDLERVELAVSLAATIAVTQMQQRHQARMTVCLHGEQMLVWEGESGGGKTEMLLEKLALAQASPEADPGLLALHSSRWRSPRTRTILITTRANDADSGGMVGLTSLQESMRDVHVLQARPDVVGRLVAYPPTAAAGAGFP